jgi:superfamily II DNA or RNA helicase/HKD family nuclease
MSADRVDILMAFVMKQGVAQISEQLSMLRDRGVRVRMLTGVYRGSSDKEAVDLLANEFGVEVKINYETHSNHLHAKAWLIRRNSGFSTAFVGSSNLSRAAFVDGMEWNVRLTERRSPHVIEKFQTEFDSHWSNESYQAYDPAINGDDFQKALEAAGGGSKVSGSHSFHFLDVQPRLHQQKMLNALDAERKVHDRHRNLIVAATGTGKTLLSAFDYKRLRVEHGKPLKLLFIAHRERILRQSRDAFAAVLNDANFGEILVGGHKPEAWNHVFASIQSLAGGQLSKIDPNRFDVIIIDEFHHAEAPTYRKIIEYFKPLELIGLTATPERADGKRVQDIFFDGRIAAELRLWEALDLQLLTPFNYYGIGDTTDFSSINWNSGKYDQTELSKILTGNDVRDRLVLKELQRKISDLAGMKALVFCVSVEHANHISAMLYKAGIVAETVLGTTKESQREASVARLSAGEIQAIVTVDVFNEGIDIPSVDTLIMLRPTESPVLFLQQLGRGLRLADSKEFVSVFDFVGLHRAEYRSDLRLEAISGVPRGKLAKSIEEGFPLLPSGVTIVLDRLSREHVLKNLKNQVNPTRKVLSLEIKKYSEALAPETLTFEKYLQLSGREIGEIYRDSTWTDLAVGAGVIPEIEITDMERQLLSRLKRFTHVDDPGRVKIYSEIAAGLAAPWADDNETNQRMRAMFHWLVWPDGKDSSGNPIERHDLGSTIWINAPHASRELRSLLKINEDRSRLNLTPVEARRSELPLLVGKKYAREEILGAIQWASLEAESVTKTGKSRSANGMQSGVCYVPEIALDCFFVTLNKVDSSFSPSTRYQDYAESRTVFHWESQNADHEETTQGRRYLNQRTSGEDVLIAIREFKLDEYGNTAPFVLAGLADYIRHESGNPLKIWWKLREPMEPDLYRMSSAVRVA